MTSRFLLTPLAALTINGALVAQTPTPAVTPPALTAEQVKSIKLQLKEVEAAIAQQRGGNLIAILQKLRTGASGDAAALALLADCEKLVSVERKELTREEEKRRENRVKRQEDLNKEKKDDEEGDMGTAVRLQLHYLVLSIEAGETDDMEKMTPKLAAYAQELVASAEKLKGRAGNHLRQAIDDNVFVDAFQLERYLKKEKWSMEPLNFGDMWEKGVLPTYRAKKKSDLAAQWDSRIGFETAFRKGAMSEAEFQLWGQSELPAVKWARAMDLYQNGDKPVNGMADMLRLVKESPAHPDSPKWLAELNKLVDQASPEANADAVPATGTPAK